MESGKKKDSFVKFPDIINVSNESRFAILSNDILFNPELSCKAKIILQIIINNKPGWKSYIAFIHKKLKEGRNSIYTGLKELEKFGYLIKIKMIDKNSKVIRCHTWGATNKPFHFNIEEIEKVARKGGCIASYKNPDVKNAHMAIPKPDVKKPHVATQHLALYNKGNNNTNNNKKNKNNKSKDLLQKDKSLFDTSQSNSSSNGKNKSIYDFPIDNFIILISSIQDRYWDSAMGCNQYHNLPFNLIRSNPVKPKAPDTTPRNNDLKPKNVKYDPLHPDNAECHRLGLKLASIIKAAGKLNPSTNVEDFGKRIKTIINEDFKSKKEKSSALLMLEELIEKYEKWIGKEYIHQAYSPNSFRKKYFDLKNRIEDQEKYLSSRKSGSGKNGSEFKQGVRLSEGAELFGSPEILAKQKILS